jgi:hypothetical protein
MKQELDRFGLFQQPHAALFPLFAPFASDASGAPKNQIQAQAEDIETG